MRMLSRLAFLIMLALCSSLATAREMLIPIPAEAQTSISAKENYATKTLASFSHSGKLLEVPVLRFNVADYKGSKLNKANVSIHVEGERAQEYTLTLVAIGGNEVIPWSATRATLANAASKPGWGEGGFAKMQHGPVLAETKLDEGKERAKITFTFTEEGVAHLQEVIDGKKPNNGFYIDVYRIKDLPRAKMATKNQRESLQPVLQLTLEQPETAVQPDGDGGQAPAVPAVVWPGDEGAIRCEVTADNSITAHSEEELDNLGAKEVVRIKHVQHLWLGKIDTAKLAGKQIVSGKLMLKKVDKAARLDLTKFWVSTITSDFVEGKGTDHEEQPLKIKGGSNFRFAGSETDFWGRPRDPNDYEAKKVTVKAKDGTPREVVAPAKANLAFDPMRWGPDDITDVIFGNGGSRYYFSAGVKVNADGWYEVMIPGHVLQALVIDEAKGLVILDGTGTDQNYEVHSRESNFKPHLLVHVTDAPAPDASAPAELSVKPLGDHAATFATLEWKEGANTYGYDIKVDGKVLPRLQSIAGKGENAQISHLIDFLTPGQHEIEVVAYNTLGKRAGSAKAMVDMPQPAPLVKLVDPANEPKARAEKAADEKAPVRVWICDEMEMVDPQTGKLFHSGDEKYVLGNSVWDGQNVSLISAKDAVVPFQVVIAPDPVNGPKGLTDIQISLSDFKAADGSRNLLRLANLVRVSQVWYHEVPKATKDGKSRYLGDAFITLDDPRNLPAFPAANVPDQANQAFIVELLVPAGAVAGEYLSDLKITTRVSENVIPVRLKVYNVTIPPKFTFRHELNLYASGPLNNSGADGYGDPDGARQVSMRVRQQARYNRCVMNNLPYTQNGRTIAAMTPKVAGVGGSIKVTDWTVVDKTLEPLATGSGFTPRAGYNGPMQGVPEPHVYLPLHESWPLPLEQYYRNHPVTDEVVAAFAEAKGNKAKEKELATQFKKEIFPAFRQQCGSPEEDITPMFADAHVAIAKQYAEHFAAKKWGNTKWQTYLNNKPSPGRATLFYLDEPVSELDFRALAYFSDLWKKGVEEANVGDKVQFEFRADISRPQWQMTFLDGHAVNLHCISSAFYRKNYLVNNRARKFGWENWVYGGGPNSQASTMNMYCQFLNVYSLGADGILPYYTGMRSDFDKFETLAMIYQTTVDKAKELGIKAKPVTITGRNQKNQPTTITYVGPFSSARLAVARSAVQDIELLNDLAARMGVHRDVMRKSLRGDFDFTLEIISTDPDDPGTTLYPNITPGQVFAFRKTLLEKLEALNGTAAR